MGREWGPPLIHDVAHDNLTSWFLKLRVVWFLPLWVEVYLTQGGDQLISWADLQASNYFESWTWCTLMPLIGQGTMVAPPLSNDWQQRLCHAVTANWWRGSGTHNRPTSQPISSEGRGWQPSCHQPFKLAVSPPLFPRSGLGRSDREDC